MRRPFARNMHIKIKRSEITIEFAMCVSLTSQNKRHKKKMGKIITEIPLDTNESEVAYTVWAYECILQSVNKFFD